MTSEQIELHCQRCSNEIHDYHRALCKPCERREKVVVVGVVAVILGVLGFLSWCGVVKG